jgi:hypothetical protein
MCGPAQPHGLAKAMGLEDFTRLIALMINHAPGNIAE